MRRSLGAWPLVLFLGLTPAVRDVTAQTAPVSPPAPPTSAIAPPRLTLALEVFVKVGAPLDLGQTAPGRRRIIPIVGGTFQGSGLEGIVLNQGADWQVVRADGFTQIDTRYALQTKAGHLIYVQNPGMRHASPEVIQRLLKGEVVDPSLVYFRTVPIFETSAPELQWLTRAIFVGVGERHPDHVVMRFWRVD